MNEQLISIIVPIYNVELYLKKCLNSIVNQTYKNIEIILIDDGSTDKSGAICDSYANVDNRIIVIHKNNEGVSSARNAGLQIAKGEYIGFVDPDDWIAEDMYEVLYLNAKKYNADVSVCKFKIVNYRFLANLTKKSNDTIFLGLKESMYYMLSYKTGYHCGPCNKLYKKEIIKEFDTKLSIAEDLLYNFEIYLEIKNGTVFENNEKYFYYYRNDSACHSLQFKKENFQEIRVWHGILKYICSSKTFRELRPLVIDSLSKTIWTSLFKLSYYNNHRNKKIYFLLKKKYKVEFEEFKAHTFKDYVLKVFYYLPYEIIGYIWKVWQYFKLLKYCLFVK